ncbi:MAG: hypothetical protein ACYTG0_23895, partial [Planctomycetota bacterium]
TYLPGADADERREFYARRLAAMTEALRASRRVAGVLYFCGLGHSWDGCATSDNFIDLNALTFEPHFLEHMQYAFAPVGLMLRAADTCKAGQKADVQVAVFNDLDTAWSGNVTVSLANGEDGEAATSQSATVAAYGSTVLTFRPTMPNRSGRCELTAKILAVDGKPVLSRRLVTVLE